MPKISLHRTRHARLSLAALAALAVVAVSVLVAAQPATATSYSVDIPFPTACGNCTMFASDALTDGGWSLNMQGDGNLVMRNSVGTACWASGTNGHSNSHVSYQSDGNFVVYSSGGTALWASGTAGDTNSSYTVSIHTGSYFVGPKEIHGPC
jgi:hypothetical protein